jgi:molecular chaperone DnaJ
MSRDLYEVLGLKEDASPAAVTAAYKKKARENHPDLNRGDPGAEERIKEVNAAYSVLSDPKRRADYDRDRRPSRQPAPDFFTGVPGFGSNPNDYFDFIAHGFSRNGFGRKNVQKGKDVESDLVLTLEESILGTTKQILCPTGSMTMCLRCNGSRSEVGTRKIPCSNCSGTGQSFYGQFGGSKTKCKVCGGHGDIPIKKCQTCSGEGTVRDSRKVDLKIPSGIEDGSKMRLAGQGEVGIGGMAGDLYLNIRVDETGSPFRRRGRDLFCESRVPFALAACSASGVNAVLKVPDISGKVHEVALPSGLRSGETVVIVSGAGVPHTNGNGNMHVLLHVDLPVVKTPRAAFLLRELLEELGEKSYSGAPGNPS